MRSLTDRRQLRVQWFVAHTTAAAAVAVRHGVSDHGVSDHMAGNSVPLPDLRFYLGIAPLSPRWSFRPVGNSGRTWGDACGYTQ